MPPRRVRGRVFSGAIAAIVAALVFAPSESLADDQAELGLEAPPGFTITRFADDSLAHDIFSLTIDTAGRVVVSGPGYVRILIDSDGDGKADGVKEYVDGPKTGAQGMFFLGRDLFCTGDAGLIRYKDEDGDDKADGPPETFLKIKTGSEHHAHAVRRGPDGWWYLIAGNFAEASEGYVTERMSAVKTPHGGVILRLKPDLSGGEIVADGFRNAYDFDFDARGEMFAYDSDGERDVSLPWYLPTRLFHVLPGGEHGWITESWKRPDYVLDSAPVVAATGRGSPSGVACYRHTQFPEAYRGGMFLLDWTFGRVFFVPLAEQGAGFSQQTAKEFIKTVGEAGFAPTDLDVGMDGSLYISVGGRGTHGSVYRVTWTGDSKEQPPVVEKPAILTLNDRSTNDQRLKACLTSPQPSSSWARARWVPAANKLGAQPFLLVALDEQRPAAMRARAVEILTELFGGLPGTAAEILATARSAELRAAAVWSLGVRPPAGLTSETLVPYLNDQEAVVRRRALEAAARNSGDRGVLLPSIARCLNDDDRLVRLAAARLVPRLTAPQFKQVADTTRQLGWKAALTTTLGYIWRTQQQNQPVNSYGIDLGRRILLGQHPRALKLEAVRLLQLALGDLGGPDETPPVFEGYSGLSDLTKLERELDPLRIAVAAEFPSGDRLMDLELARLTAMLGPLNDTLLDKLLAKITDESSPVDDIHYLIVAAKLPVVPDQPQTERLAKALVDFDRKIARDNLQQDNNWNVRVGEMYAALCARADELPQKIVRQAGFGRPGHVIFISKLSADLLPEAIAAFTKAVTSDPNYAWINDVVFVVGYGKTPAHRDLVRRQWEKFELRMAVLMVLAEAPEEQDRGRFAAGLEFGPVEILNTCLNALFALPAKNDAEETVALVKLLRRLGSDKTEFALREQVVRLLERNTGEKFSFVFGTAGYVPQPESIEKWTEYATKTFPEEAQRRLGAGDADLKALRDRLAAIAWESGSAERGEAIYTRRGCGQCHGGGRGLGPDLAGATSRFSREDLLIAIALPNRDVSPRYQTLLVETKAGKIYTGLVVYESVDGLLLRNGTNQTFRIEARDIESRRNLPTSLMPEGLLKDLADRDVADLYAYLKTLGAKTAALPAAAVSGTQTE
ncbi:MAG: PVC-type heme-binding CxxCH protein [Planctomycetaceae bacterium]